MDTFFKILIKKNPPKNAKIEQMFVGYLRAKTPYIKNSVFVDISMFKLLFRALPYMGVSRTEQLYYFEFFKYF